MSDKIKDGKVLKSKHFNGDILITDPCYILKDESYDQDWSKCKYGYNMEKLGIKNYITNSTLYGDWSCTVWKSSYLKECTKENVIGKFCADAGLVSVFLLDEVRRYNPDIDEWIKNHSWCAAVIKKFDGDVQMMIYSEEYERDDDFIDSFGHVYWRKGEKYKYDYLKLYGVVNNKIVWMSGQTGF